MNDINSGGERNHKKDLVGRVDFYRRIGAKEGTHIPQSRKGRRGRPNRKEGLFEVKRGIEAPACPPALPGASTSQSSRWLIINTRQARSIPR